MPVKTCEGKYIDVPLSQCFGKKCTDGRFHVILEDGTCGVWMGEAAIEAENEKMAEDLERFMLQPVKPRAFSFDE